MAAEACPVLVSESLFQGDEGPVNGGGNYDPLKVTNVALSKIGYLREHPSILAYRVAVIIVRCGQSAGKTEK